MDLSLPQLIAVYALPLVLGITLHEAAHAWVASLLGDQTARMLGRVTMNPLKHIDPMGTIVVPGLMLLAAKAAGGGGGFFGWAKPVPVVWSNLRSPRRDMGLVAAAGPLANIAMAMAWALGLKLLFLFGVNEEFLSRMMSAGITVNLVLAALNLLPVLPLDGGRILVSLLPRRAAMTFAKLEPYGMFVLLGLVFSGLLSRLTDPLISLGIALISDVFGFVR
jgi:Zn-dependent protease